MRRKPWSLTTTLFATLLSMLAASSDTAEATAGYRHGFELGFGNQIPMQERLRNGFDTDYYIVAGYSSVFDSEVKARLQLEVSWTSSSGHFYSVDPTFEIDETKLKVWGTAVGATRFFSTYEGSPFELHMGIGVVAHRLAWDTPGSDERTGIAYGVYGDLRPELRVLPGWHLWVRQRLMGTSEVTFLSSDVTDSGVFFSAGVRYAFGEILR